MQSSGCPPRRQRKRHEGLAVVKQCPTDTLEGEISNNVPTVVDIEGDSHHVTTWRRGIWVIDACESTMAVDKPTRAAHVWKRHSPNNLARFVETKRLGEVGTREIDDGERTIAVKVSVRSGAAVEVADNLTGRVDAEGPRGSAVRGNRAGDNNRGKDSTTVQEPMCARVVTEIADDVARGVNAEGLSKIGAWNIDGVKDSTDVEELVSAESPTISPGALMPNALVRFVAVARARPRTRRRRIPPKRPAAGTQKEHAVVPDHQHPGLVR